MQARKILGAIEASREVISRQVEARATSMPEIDNSAISGEPEGLLDGLLRVDLIRAGQSLAALGRIEAETRRELAGKVQRTLDKGGGTPPESQ